MAGEQNKWHGPWVVSIKGDSVYRSEIDANVQILNARWQTLQSFITIGIKQISKSNICKISGIVNNSIYQIYISVFIIQTHNNKNLISHKLLSPIGGGLYSVWWLKFIPSYKSAIVCNPIYKPIILLCPVINQLELLGNGATANTIKQIHTISTAKQNYRVRIYTFF